jgi:hypothetical protein
MEEKIKELYENINFLGFGATYARNHTYVKSAVTFVPEIQEFVQWFLENISGLEEGVYHNLVDILKDCEIAFQENDNVLLMDALEQGLAGYLEMFLPEGYFEEKEKVYVEVAKEQKS